jgi:hypothetical protein
VPLLILEGKAWDRYEQARPGLADDGLTSQPEGVRESNSHIAVARLVKGLDLDALGKELGFDKGGVSPSPHPSRSEPCWSPDFFRREMK